MSRRDPITGRRAAPRKYEPTCTCDDCRSRRTPWEGVIDTSAVDYIKRVLGINRPVVVHPYHERHNDDSAGLCSTGFTPDGLKAVDHEIWVHESLDSETANTTLLHELRHCWQAEQTDYGSMERAKRRYGYENSPIEIDADRFADAMAPTVTVAR